MTYIRQVRVRNFMCYRGEHELTLGPGCYAIVAEHEQDAGRSNYLGKSSFLTAIRWCLEGTKTDDQDTLDDFISWGESEMGVDIELSDGWFFSRERKRGKATDLVVEPPPGAELGKQKGDVAQATIESVLGIDMGDRSTTCWSDQGELAVLVKAKSGELTAMVERWLELDKLIHAGDLVTKKLGEHSNEYAAALAVVKELEESSSSDAIAALEARLVVLERDHAARVAEADRIRIRREQHAERRVLREKIDEFVEVVRELKVPKAKQPENLDDIEAQLLDETQVKKDRDASRDKKTEAEREHRRLKQLVEGRFDGACPVSDGFKCPATSEINKRREPNQQAYERAKAALAEATKKADEDAAQLKKIEDFKERERRSAEARATEAERVRLLEERKRRLEAEIKKAKDAGVVPLEPGEQAPPMAVSPDLSEVERVRSELTVRRAARDELPEARAHAEEMAKRARAHQLAAKILGPEGARRLAADGAVRYIEQQANAKLADAGIALTVRAAWGRETSRLADQCDSCGTAFPRSQAIKACERCGENRKLKVEHKFRWCLSQVSGAAKDLAGLALRAAAFEWLRAARDAAWSVAIFDEPTGQLDRAHRAAVSAGIRRLLVGTFEQAFITAHEPGVLEACDRRLLISSTGTSPVWSTIRAL